MIAETSWVVGSNHWRGGSAGVIFWDGATEARLSFVMTFMIPRRRPRIAMRMRGRPTVMIRNDLPYELVDFENGIFRHRPRIPRKFRHNAP